MGNYRGSRMEKEQSAKQILCLHGWQDNSNTFKKLVPLLPEDYWLVALDFPGHGFSSHRVPGMPYHGPDYLIDLKAVLARKRPEHLQKLSSRSRLILLIIELGWKNYTVIGHSMGAGIALAVRF